MIVRRWGHGGRGVRGTSADARAPRPDGWGRLAVREQHRPWPAQPTGGMFWLSRKRFVGSYVAFTAASRAYLAGL